MSINTAPIFDFAAWIDLAPEYDWNALAAPAAEEPAPDPDPEPDPDA